MLFITLRKQFKNFYFLFSKNYDMWFFNWIVCSCFCKEKKRKVFSCLGSCEQARLWRKKIIIKVVLCSKEDKWHYYCRNKAPPSGSVNIFERTRWLGRDHSVSLRSFAFHAFGGRHRGFTETGTRLNNRFIFFYWQFEVGYPSNFVRKRDKVCQMEACEKLWYK